MMLHSPPSNNMLQESIKRSATLDYARFLAAVGIIVFHVGAAGANIGYAALPFFIMLLVVLAFPGAERLDFRTYARSRAVRLLLPWVVWSLIYGSLKLAEVGLTNATIQSEFALWMLFAGPSLHLWFMPFAYATCLAIWPLAQRSSELSPRWLMVCGALDNRACSSARIHWRYNHSNSTRHTMAPCAACGHTGVRVRLLAQTSQSGPAHSNMHGCPCRMPLAADWPIGSMPLTIASAAFTFCMALPLPDRPAARRVAALSLTLYLAHPMVISVLLRVSSLEAESLQMTVWAVLGTTLFAALLQKISVKVRKVRVLATKKRKRPHQKAVASRSEIASRRIRLHFHRFGGSLS